MRAGSDDLAAPLMSGVSAPFHGLRSIRESFGEHWAVHRQNEELRARLEEMEAWRQLALSLRDTVSAYEAILDVPVVEALDPVVAWTVAESGGPFQHVRLMDVGANGGVKPGYPVLTDRGLIGRVISVSDRSSRILLLTDANSRVPVMTEDGRVRAMLVGDNTNTPKLEFTSGPRPLQRGDRIVTSGEAGVFPRNLPVGGAAPAGDVWRVQLYASSQQADLVWIYPHEPIAPPPPDAVTPIYPPELETAPDPAGGAGAATAGPQAALGPSAAQPAVETPAPAPAEPLPATAEPEAAQATDTPPPAAFVQSAPDPATAEPAPQAGATAEPAE